MSASGDIACGSLTTAIGNMSSTNGNIHTRMELYQARMGHVKLLHALA